jgi:hypothetical protein
MGRHSCVERIVSSSNLTEFYQLKLVVEKSGNRSYALGGRAKKLLSTQKCHTNLQFFIPQWPEEFICCEYKYIVKSYT